MIHIEISARYGDLNCAVSANQLLSLGGKVHTCAVEMYGLCLLCSLRSASTPRKAAHFPSPPPSCNMRTVIGNASYL